jgi:hypothetical protein
MKTITRISTGEYEYLEIQEEVSSVEQAIELHNQATSAYKSLDGGLDQKEWNKALDGYITNGTMPSDVGERMNKAQSWLIHELDKSSARINK